MGSAELGRTAVRHDDVFSGILRWRSGTGKADSAFFAMDNYKQVTTLTNEANGQFLWIEHDAVWVDTGDSRYLDALATAKAIAAVARGGSFDFLWFGQKGVGYDESLVGPMAAELLDLPHVGSVVKLEVAAGKVTGRWPDGFTSPNSTRAIACPPRWPGYQASSTAPTLSSHGIVTAPPVSSTTTVFGFAAASAAISAS